MARNGELNGKTRMGGRAGMLLPPTDLVAAFISTSSPLLLVRAARRSRAPVKAGGFQQQTCRLSFFALCLIFQLSGGGRWEFSLTRCGTFLTNCLTRECRHH